MTHDPRAIDLEWHEAQRVDGTFEPMADPLNSGASARGGLSGSASLVRGVVMDAIAYTHCYRVAFENARSVRPCVLAAHSGFLAYGARSLNTLTPGSYVWVALPLHATYGVILGVEPAPSVDASGARPDYFHQTSRCGLRVDRAHGAIFDEASAGGVINWSGGRPVDSIPIGEWGAITETGLRIALDPFMAQLAVDEATGIFAFYHDQLLRIAGVNLQEFSSAHDREYWDDRGEHGIYRGESVYPWERIGSYSPVLTPSRSLADLDTQVNQAHYASVEPLHDDQTAFHRLIGIGGYLGQGGRRLLLAPPKPQESGPPPSFHRLRDVEDAVALFSEHLALTGGYSIQSAKSIVIAKRGAIPSIRRIRRPDDANGDGAEDYLPSGFGDGEGDPHVVTDTTKTSTADLPDGDTVPQTETRTNRQRIAGLADIHARIFNWEGVHPLHYHAKDWRVPEESEASIGPVQSPINFADLSDVQSLEPPVASTHVIDHRYGEASYYPNESHLSLLEDGGVALSDGYAAGLHSTGGNLWLTAPGDINIQAGRNVNIWAGKDLIFRARCDADISTTEGAVRIKAETVLHALAGNSGTGGILLESKGEPAYDYVDKVGSDVVSGGVQIKSGAAPFVVWAADIYLRTGGGDIQPGQIVLDAGAGSGSITTVSSDYKRFLSGTAADYFGSQTITSVNLFGESGTRLGSGLSVNGSSNLGGGAIINGNVNIVGGHIGTEQSGQNQGLIGEFDSGSLASLRKAGGTPAADARADEKQGGIASEEFKLEWYGEGKAGADETIEAAGFSFRTSEQMKSETYAHWESRWQQMARLTGQELKSWTEVAVKAAAKDTYPYPGERCLDEGSLVTQDLALADSEAGVSVDRGEHQAEYEAPELPAPQPSVLNTTYLVIP